MGETGAFVAGSIVSKLLLDNSQFKASVGEALKKSESLNAMSPRLASGFRTAGFAMTAVGGAVVSSLVAMTKKAADYGDKINDLRQRTGIAAKTLTSLKLSADMSGTSLEKVAIGMKGLATRMVDATRGGKESISMFSRLGVEVTDQNGKLRGMESVLFDVADKFAGMEDGAAKTEMAVKLFGRSGMDMIPMLNLGSKGLKENADEAQRLGLVLDDKAAAASDRFNDEMEKLKGSLMGVGLQIGQTLIPYVQSLVISITNIIAKFRAWAAEHPGIIKIVGAVGAVMAALGPVLIILPKIAAGFGLLKSGISGVATSIGKFNPAQFAANGLFVIAVGLCVKYAAKLIELKDAIDEGDKAHNRFIETNTSLKNKLYELVKAGAMTVDEFYKLEDRLDGSAAQMAMWIKSGKAGEEAQKALVDIGKKHGATIDELSKKTEDLTGATDGLTIAGGSKNKVLDTQNKLEAKAIPQARQLAGVVEQAAGAFESAWNPLYDLNTVLSLAPDKFQDVEYAIQDLPPVAQAATETTRGYFDGLYNDIASGMGTAMQGLVAEIGKGLNFANMEFFKGGINFKATFDAIWTTVKQGFFRMIGEMVTDWAMGGMKDILNITKKTTTDIVGETTKIGSGFKGIGSIITGLATTIGTVLTTLATAVGTVITTLATAIGTGVVTIATAIGTAVVTLATSIATAATALAAAAPALVVVGLIATGVYAATKLLGALIGGGGGKQTDVTYWLKPISERAQEIRDWLFINAQERLNFLSIQITDLKTTFITHVGDRIRDFMVQAGNQLQTIYQGTNPYLRTIAAESKLLSNINAGIQGMLKALTAKHTLFVRDEALLKESKGARKKPGRPINEPFGPINRPISGPVPFSPLNRPISGPIPGRTIGFGDPNRPISGPLPYDPNKPKPKPKPGPGIDDDITWLKRIHGRLAVISDILLRALEPKGLGGRERPGVPLSPLFAGPGRERSGVNVAITFDIRAHDRNDVARFIEQEAKPSLKRVIQRMLQGRELTVPAGAVGK